MVMWAACRGTVDLVDGRRVTLVHWGPRSKRVRIEIYGRHYSELKADVVRPVGSVTIGGVTFNASDAAWPTPSMIGSCPEPPKP